MKTCFCEVCFSEFNGSEQVKVKQISFKGENISYSHHYTLCPNCRSECHSAEQEDANLFRIFEEYKNLKGLMDWQAVEEMIQIYHFSLEHLSIFLSVERSKLEALKEGYLCPPYLSHKLETFLSNPNLMLKEIELAYKKNNIAYPFYQTYRLAIADLCKPTEEKLNTVVAYILKRCPNHDAKFLQKSLYYLQGFYLGLMGQPLFQEDCQAWVHGPVYPRIYAQQRWRTAEPLHENKLSGFDDLFVKAVIEILKDFNGEELEELTHSEDPWLNTRQDLKEKEGSNRVISKQSIKAYFSDLMLNLEIFSIDDIEQYFKIIKNNCS